jgi:hypothetical protein
MARERLSSGDGCVDVRLCGSLSSCRGAFSLTTTEHVDMPHGVIPVPSCPVPNFRAYRVQPLARAACLEPTKAAARITRPPGNVIETGRTGAARAASGCGSSMPGLRVAPRFRAQNQLMVNRPYLKAFPATAAAAPCLSVPAKATITKGAMQRISPTASAEQQHGLR